MQRAVQRSSATLRCGLSLSRKQKVAPLPRGPSRLLSSSTCPRYLVKGIHTSSVHRAGRAIDFRLSDIGEGISEVVIKEWYVGLGSKVNQFDPICEVQSDKASVTITSRYDGVIKKLNYEVEQVCKVGAALVEIEVASDAAVDSRPTLETETLAEEEPVRKSQPSPAVTPIESGKSAVFVDKVLATPAVRRFATEMNVALSAVRATGKNGRVLKDDIVAYTQNKPSVERPAPTTQDEAPRTRIVDIGGYTRAMLKTMTKSLQIPHFGYKDEVEMDALMAIRKDLVAQAKSSGVKLSYMPFFIKAASVALLEYPILNASLSDCQEKIIYKDDHNIGLAMDTPQGLIVPNIKKCQEKSILEIAAELNRLQEACLNGKVGTQDLVEGTFSLSNIGSIGGTYAFPVLVQPEVCIGALGRIRKLPRFSPAGEIVPVNVLNVSWSADHRVIDGATVSRFSNVWKNYLEKPHALLMTLK
ncbi:lipoamide acyltransferase component of branched-chain alpha-keto acid dehydrogenase complex, mitochondrial [Galendromus occidentalis]|uniref:Dihydrolipoamide acetyltransferase component of pyruvate dehydrogenase complex n=1 Tax=Galendromus occidentalis TaxID=34638 RepID=A0AAJ7L5L4_9ACAR|nr:lipoamide acyltransferase component of branched-chain alpha-keto acid dehydrogenase complex, mitochondrial [Galendromus occidentalis]